MVEMVEVVVAGRSNNYCVVDFWRALAQNMLYVFVTEDVRTGGGGGGKARMEAPTL